MYWVEVPNGCVQQAFKRCRTNALENPRADQTLVIVAYRPSPCTRSNHKAYSDEEEVAFSPDTAGGNEEYSGRARA